MKEMVGGCCVCSDDRGWKENPLVYCDGHGCSVAVHQACYGIVSVPSGPWYCRKCESQERAARVKCELCPQKDGALKRTESGGWCHVVCALYIPEAWFHNVDTMEPIVLKSVPQDRFNRACYICEERKKDATKVSGACVQCNKAGCRQFFHVTCAQSQGLLCEESGGNEDNVKYTAYCMYHHKKLRKDANIKTIPAFKPIPVDKGAAEMTREKRGNGSSRLLKEKKTYRSGSSINLESSHTSTESPGDPEMNVESPCASSRGLALRGTSTTKSTPTIRTRRSGSVLAEGLLSLGSFLVGSATDTQDNSSTTVTSSENLFATQCHSLLSSGGSSGVFGSVASCRSNKHAGQSVIVTEENCTPGDGGRNCSNGVFLEENGLLTAPLVSHGSSSETAEVKQLRCNSQVRRGRKPKKPAQSITKKKRSLSSGQEGGSDTTDGKVNKEESQEPAYAASASAFGHPSTAGSVFGGSPCFQRPVSITSFSSPDGEMVNGTNAFTLPLPPKSVPDQLAHKLDADNGRMPKSLTELLEQQWDSTTQFLMEHTDHFEVAVVLQQLHNLKSQNHKLEEQVKMLASYREQLQSSVAQLAIPFTNTPHRLPGALSKELPIFGDKLNSMETSKPSKSELTNLSTSQSPHLPMIPPPLPGGPRESVRPVSPQLLTQSPDSCGSQCSSVVTSSSLQES